MWSNPVGGTIDRQSRNRSTRCSEVHLLLAKLVTAGEQVAARNHLSNCPVFPGLVSQGRAGDPSTDSRVPILARIHHLGSGKLDVDNLLRSEPNGVELGAVQGGTSAHRFQHVVSQTQARDL